MLNLIDEKAECSREFEPYLLHHYAMSSLTNSTKASTINSVATAFEGPVNLDRISTSSAREQEF